MRVSPCTPPPFSLTSGLIAYSSYPNPLKRKSNDSFYMPQPHPRPHPHPQCHCWTPNHVPNTCPSQRTFPSFAEMKNISSFSSKAEKERWREWMLFSLEMMLHCRPKNRIKNLRVLWPNQGKPVASRQLEKKEDQDSRVLQQRREMGDLWNLCKADKLQLSDLVAP